jgi:hypothetical protein
MYMKSLSVRKDKLLTEEAIARWFEYLHKHAPGDTVRALFVSLSPCPFCSPLTIKKQYLQVWVLLGTFNIFIYYVGANYTCDILLRRLGRGRNK